MRGACLCGNVEFELAGEAYQLYQCHCSLCRKQSGTASNAATIVPKRDLRWISGSEHVSSWRKASGFRSDFCSGCGSPVPNPLGDMPYYWVPAGLLEDNGRLEIVAQLCVASKASWDRLHTGGICCDALPDDLTAFIDRLRPPRDEAAN